MKKTSSCPVCQHAIDTYKVSCPQNLETHFSPRTRPSLVYQSFVLCPHCLTKFNTAAFSVNEQTKLYQKSELVTLKEAEQAAQTYYHHLKKICAPQLKFLEIGCSNGILLQYLNDQEQIEITGLELSEDARLKARLDIQDRILNESLHSDLFPEASFDIIFMAQTLEHLSNPNEVIQFCHYWLSPMGKIILVTHDYNSPTNKILGKKSPIYDVQHNQVFCAQSLDLLLENNRFSKQEQRSFINYYSVNYALYLLKASFPFLPKISLPEFLDFKIPFIAGNLLSIYQKNS